MSYNADTSRYLSGHLFITKGAVRKFLTDLGDDLPSNCFLRQINHDDPHLCDPVLIKNFSWSGEWSGHSFETSLRKVLAETIGEAVLLFIWEGGDSMSALHVKDGVVTEKTPRIVVD